MDGQCGVAQVFRWWANRYPDGVSLMEFCNTTGLNSKKAKSLYRKIGYNKMGDMVRAMPEVVKVVPDEDAKVSVPACLCACMRAEDVCMHTCMHAWTCASLSLSPSLSLSLSLSLCGYEVWAWSEAKKVCAPKFYRKFRAWVGRWVSWPAGRANMARYDDPS